MTLADFDSRISTAQLVMVFVSLAVITVSVTVTLSRLGYLSASRWYSLARFLLFCCVGLVIEICIGLPLLPFKHHGPSKPLLLDPITSVVICLIPLAIIGIGGCFLAAVIYPKSR